MRLKRRECFLMGTIRNRMVIVHSFDFTVIQALRDDAIVYFQKVADQFPFMEFDVKNEMVSNIMAGFSNREYTFVINGECSKLGWPESDVFQAARKEWCEQHYFRADNILIVDFGEDQQAFVKEYTRDC